MTTAEVAETLEGASLILEAIAEESGDARAYAVRAAVDACADAVRAMWEREDCGWSL